MTGDLKIRSQIWGDMEILEFFFLSILMVATICQTQQKY